MLPWAAHGQVGFSGLEGSTTVQLNATVSTEYPANFAAYCEAWDNGRNNVSCQASSGWFGEPDDARWPFYIGKNAEHDVEPMDLGVLVALLLEDKQEQHHLPQSESWQKQHRKYSLSCPSDFGGYLSTHLTPGRHRRGRRRARTKDGVQKLGATWTPATVNWMSQPPRCLKRVDICHMPVTWLS